MPRRGRRKQPARTWQVPAVICTAPPQNWPQPLATLGRLGGRTGRHHQDRLGGSRPVRRRRHGQQSHQRAQGEQERFAAAAGWRGAGRAARIGRRGPGRQIRRSRAAGRRLPLARWRVGGARPQPPERGDGGQSPRRRALRGGARARTGRRLLGRPGRRTRCARHHPCRRRFRGRSRRRRPGEAWFRADA
jgi:hypothetical protein